MTRQYVPNAWPLGSTHHVAQQRPEAADSNPGTAAQPFKTISAAAKVVQPYDTILIDEGIYREQVPIVREGNRNISGSWIVFAAVTGKEVYLKGSDVFDPEWQEIGPAVFKAPLPKSLFEKNAYNPYEMTCTPAPCPVNYEFDRGGYDPGEPIGPTQVRPATDPVLPETLGQIYVDNEALQQLDSLEAVHAVPGAFVVSADGKEIICHFAGGKAPEDELVELTVRERCFKPEFPVHWAGLMIRTLGMAIEHAAEPGAFSRCRPLYIRRNAHSGIAVRKTFHAQCSVSGGYVTASNYSYLGPSEPTIISTILDGTKQCQPNDRPVNVVVSHYGAATWETVTDGPLADPVANYFLDKDNGMLIRHYRTRGDGEIYNDKAVEQHAEQKLVIQVSPDSGKTWGKAEELGFGEDIVCFTLMKLQNGQLFWIIEENRPQFSAVANTKPDAIFFVCQAWLGTWRPDRSGLDWEKGGLVQIPSDMSSQGVGEPQACQLPDGRLFAIFRQSIVLPSQDGPGYPSVKHFSVSDDNGKTWQAPKPLTFEDGKYVYSSTSFGSAFCSSKNGRVYIITNILNRPNEGCLPRNVLHIAEIDQDTFCARRDTVSAIEAVHEEHTSHGVGYSNWGMLEDRDKQNLNLFMNLENGPVHDGYDWNSYRYEIEFPA